MNGANSVRSGRRLAIASTLALTMGLIVATAPSAFPSAGRTPSKVDARVTQQIKAHGSANYWIEFRAKANLTKAPSIKNWVDRGNFVVNALKNTANASQRDVRSLLTSGHVSYQSFWIYNAIRVSGGNAATAAAAAARPEVSRVLPDWSATVPAFTGKAIPVGLDGLEWNIKNIKANKVWKTLGVRGEGAVVANIDTGVQYNHPALVAQYRGNLGGSFDHNYNWWDPSHVCANNTPCDNVDHGTHTMGTMVGKAGTTKIGVAPLAKWIAAKGFE
jgi:subtilisin family serine protease